MTAAPARHLRPTWYEIDLGAVAHNVRELRRLVGPGVAIYACLKRNAYGCGAPAVAPVCMQAGADGLAVGNIDDALAIRAAGVAGPLLLYPSCLPEVAATVEALDLVPTVSTVEEAAAWNAAFSRRRKVFLKVDVGLLRAGSMVGQLPDLLHALGRLDRLEPAGLYGHFFSYGAAVTAGQYEWQFARMAAAMRAAADAGVALPIVMVSSTSAVLDHPEMDLTGVDPGRLLYGLSASAHPARHGTFRQALVGFKTRLVMRKTLGALDPGDFALPFAPRPGMRIGILPLGWGDGLPRPLPEGAAALVRGRRVALVGPVHLEHTRIDLTDAPDATPGDEVVLIGRQGDAEITLAEAVALWGIDETTFHGQMRDHIPRRYVDLAG
ncbi:MAG: alanine racemase [Alphaproteobacteria bacterium]|nr:alanine racemase [Alphaproteobacteria bacterium]